MAITINVQTADGMNINQGGTSYLAELPLMFNSSKNLGYFKDALENSPQYGVAELQDETGTYRDGATLLAGGKLSYSLQTHLVEGKLNSLALGDGLEGVDNGMYLAKQTMNIREPVVSFGKLGLDSAKGDSVSDILYGIMTGDEAALLKFLAQSAVKFNGGAGDDAYTGGSKADVPNGKAGTDILIGGKGDDKLTGGLGPDTMTGGAGKDQFIFKSTADSVPEAADTINDFNGKQGDRINLKAIDADTTTSGNQAFEFIGGDDFSGKPGEFRVEKSGAGFDIFGDTDGDGTVDFLIHLAKGASLAESAFAL